MNCADLKDAQVVHDTTDAAELASRFVEKGLPTRVMFYCSPLMRCVEEQYKAVFNCVKDLNLVHPSNNSVVKCVFSYAFPESNELQKWDTDCTTLYVLAMNVRELTRMLHRSGKKLPLYYVWYQTEQFSNTRFFGNPLWMRALSSALWIWEYSEANAEYLKTRVGNAKITLVRHAFCETTMLHKQLLVPRGPAETTEDEEKKEIEKHTESANELDTDNSTNVESLKIPAAYKSAAKLWAQKRVHETGRRAHRSYSILQKSTLVSGSAGSAADIHSCDVLLLGVVAGAARTKCVRLLRDKYKLTVGTPPRGRYWYGAEREKEIRKAKVCINVHYFRTPSVLETARLNLLLANGSVVVSEHSTAGDGIMDRRYEQANAVLFVDQDDFEGLGQLCRQLVDNSAERLAQRQRAVAFSQSAEQTVQTQTREMQTLFTELYAAK